MASASPAFGTNNPFRRKSGSPSFSAATTTAAALPGGSPAPSASLDHGDGPFAPAAPRPPLTTFRSASYDDYHGRDDGPVQPKPKKIVKKVRVQSPPPSSPEDAVPVTTRYPPIDYDDASSLSSASRDDDDGGGGGGRADPFHAELADGDSEHYIAGEPPLSRPLPNPFSKTPGHLENHEGGSASGARGGLDVDSFKRLLLTGYANTPGPGGQSGNTGAATGPGHDGASTTDASSVSRQSIADATQETPRTSHEISEAEENGERRGIHPSSPLSTIQSTSGRKKPPPPSSRHGKLIKIELGAEVAPGGAARDPRRPASIDTTLPVARQSTPPSASDVNKPLPLPPNRRVEDGTESPFDREAAGKLPEVLADLTTNPRPPTPPAGTRSRSESQVSTSTTSSMRKPAAPPPRRPGPGPGRTESQASPQVASPGEEDPPRGSMDSSRSRTESFRGVAAPAPPPPRRPAHGRSASSVMSPSGSSFVSLSSLGGGSDGTSSPKGAVPDRPQAGSAMATVTTSKDGLPKLSPPPPPPARHSSTRRQPSLGSTDMGSRRASKEKEGGGARPPPPPPRGRGGSRGNAGKPIADPAGFETPTGAGADILKDLETLQRELNAAMGGHT